MSDQLGFVCTLFEKHRLEYWIDGGSLLGLLREGDLLSYDRDLDIGVWRKDESTIVQIIPVFESEGYRLVRYKYKDTIYKYKFEHKYDKQLRKVDINIFDHFGEYAWSPADYMIPNPSDKGTLGYLIMAAIRFPIVIVYRTSSFLHLHSFPINLIVKMGCWLVPVKYFQSQETIMIRGSKVFIPAFAEDYLVLRYNDWKTPKKSWNYWTDDGSIVQKEPESVAKDISKKLM